MTHTTTTEVELSWADLSDDEDGFELQRAPDSGGVPGTFVVVASLAADTTEHTVDALAPDSTYWFRVRAHARGAFSAYSNQVDARTDPLFADACDWSVYGSIDASIDWTSVVPRNGRRVVAGMADGIFGGSFSAPVVAELDAAGAVLWCRAYPRTDTVVVSRVQSMHALLGDELLVVLEVGSSSVDSTRLLLFLDAAGNPLRVRYSGIEVGRVAVSSHSPELYLYGRSVASLPLEGSLLLRMTVNGDLASAWSIGGLPNATFPFSLRATSDGGLVLLDGRHHDASLFLALGLVKLDASGTIVWARNYGTPFGEIIYPRDVVETADGGFLALGMVGTPPAHDPLYLRVDQDGHVVWQQRARHVLVNFQTTQMVELGGGRFGTLYSSSVGLSVILHVVGEDGVTHGNAEYLTSGLPQPLAVLFLQALAAREDGGLDLVGTNFTGLGGSRGVIVEAAVSAECGTLTEPAAFTLEPSSFATLPAAPVEVEPVPAEWMPYLLVDVGLPTVLELNLTREYRAR
ncbi:MAG: fibronectin type III domain-containing protein [Planctomycetes bacterium]|nr:fibronectin type III domain-containing protein [Planctomycetota bacterium]